MKKSIKLTQVLTALGMLMLVSTMANAQCNIVPNRYQACVGDNIQFNMVPNTTTFASILWSFGDGDSSVQPNTQQDHIYTKTGTFIATLTLYNSDKTIKCGPSTVTIKIFDKPKAGLILPDSTTMCFESNYFCFKDSSFAGKDKAPIKTYNWDLGDGNYSTATNPCHKYGKDGRFTIYLTVTDTNGCVDSASKITAIHVLPKLAPDFTTNFKIACPATPVTFTNITDTNGKDISNWWWNFGDGNWDSSNYGINYGKNPFVYTYGNGKKKDGNFNPVLYIKSKWGCLDSVVKYAGAQNIFYWFDIIKDQAGPVCWEGNNVCFKQTARPRAYYKLWTFDDPPSQLLNFNDEDWAPCHHYTAPGFYHVTLKIWEPNCIRDTTFCSYIPLKGPQAMINLPPPPAFPANNCVRAKPIPASAFHAALSKCWNPMGDPIDYVTRTKVPKFQVGKVDTYCFSLVDTASSVTSYKPGCNPLDSIITNVTWPMLSPPVSSGILYDSIIEVAGSWTPGSPLPAAFYTGSIYYPFGGSCNQYTMHDTDKYIANCQGPNYVRFTNNSIKYRLYYSIDNSPPSYFGGPSGAKPDAKFDRCWNPSYPWASDSMEYFWDFGDGVAPACTSTKAAPNINCRFSTEIQPWHLYKETGCWVARLTVIDHVTNCISEATQTITMEPPDASWDETKYTYLDWMKQLRTPPVMGRRGVILNGIPCVGQPYPQKPSFSETKPSCDRQKWWMVFDSAQDCSATCTDVTYLDLDNDGIAENAQTHKTITCAWIDDITFMMMGNQWIYGSGGWKTIGLIIKTGDCFDTFFYPMYKYIFDLQIGLNINDPDKYNDTTGKYPPMDYANLQYQKLCAPHQGILTVADTNQEGIVKYYFMVSKFFPPDSWQSPGVSMKDSCKITKPDTCYMVCHKDSFTIDPFTGKKVYNYCFLYPDITKGEKVSWTFLNTFLNSGYFLKDTMPQLKLTDTIYIKTDTAPRKTRIEPEYSLSVPGKYNLSAQIRNVYGCVNMAAAVVIVGHYADFWADDTIICYENGGDTVTFQHLIRYFWDPQTPIQPDINPNQYWIDPLNTQGGTYYDPDPVYGPRGVGVPPDAPYIPEEVWWDFDDGTGWHQQSNISDTIKWVFNLPKDYKIRMRSIDSTGCEQITTRVIKVIGVVADFEFAAAPDICAPQQVQFLDKSFGLNTWRYTYWPNGTVKDSSMVDSTNYWIWEFGDTASLTANFSYIKDPVHTYKRNGTFDVRLIVKNSNGCADTLLKSDYVSINGPKPKFWLYENGDTTWKVEGCVTLTVGVLDSSESVGTWQFDKGDATTETYKSRPGNNQFTLTYTKPGTYYVKLIASDSFYNPAAGQWQTCTDRYADKNLHPEDPIFKVVVHGIPKTKLEGDTLICSGSEAVFKDLSDSGYEEMIWNLGDGTPIFTQDAGDSVVWNYSSGSSYDTTYTVEMDGLGNMCPDKLKSLTIRVVKTDANVVVQKTQLPIITFGNLSKGATHYKWTIKGIDATTGNTNYYKEFSTQDTNALVNDFGNIKGDFLVCIETWINRAGMNQGCPDSSCIIVNNFYEIDINPPNIFTPGNKDGVNDVFDFRTKGVEKWDLTIFNRWGEKVFETNNPDEHWNGTNKNDGSECPGGVYYYVLNYQLRGEKVKSISGSVTLMR